MEKNNEKLVQTPLVFNHLLIHFWRVPVWIGCINPIWIQLRCCQVVKMNKRNTWSKWVNDKWNKKRTIKSSDGKLNFHLKYRKLKCYFVSILAAQCLLILMFCFLVGVSIVVVVAVSVCKIESVVKSLCIICWCGIFWQYS